MSHSSRRPERRKRFAARLTLFFYGAQLLGGCLPAPASSEGPDGLSRSRSRVTSAGISFELGPDTILDTGTPGVDAPGITPFVADVTQNGSASVTVPLWVPAGRAGIQPSLSIVYDSQGSDGLLGPGFNLSGLSQISLCPNSFARDGKTIAIDFSPDMTLNVRDRYTRAYCLDGVRLVPSENDPRSFKTEHDSYASIRIPADSDPQDPVTFEVRGRDGLIRTYGKTLSREDALIQGLYEKLGEGSDGGTIQVTETKPVKLAWALAAVEDHPGNRMDVFYDQASLGAESGAWHRPDRIVYTQFHNDSGTLEPGTREVKFNYGPRTDVFTGYLAGVKVGRDFRLTGIDMKGPGIATGSGSPPTVVLRSYNLTYYPSLTSKRSLLTELRECDGKNVCKAPVRFDWEQGSWEFEYPPAQDVSDAAQGVGVHAFGLGAGRQGLAYFVKSEKRSEEDLVMPDRVGTTTGFTAQIWEDTMRLLQFPDAASPTLTVSNVTGRALWYPYFNIAATNWADDVWDAIFGDNDPGDYCGNRAQRNLFPLVADWDGAGRSTVTSLSCKWGVPKDSLFFAPMYGHGRVGSDGFLAVGSEPNFQYWLDVDGDGRNDLVWMGQHDIDLTGDADSMVPAKRRVVVNPASGKETKESPTGFFQPSRFGLRAVDLDGSGKMSLLGVGPNGNSFLEGLAYHEVERGSMGLPPAMDPFKTTIRKPLSLPPLVPNVHASTFDFVDVNGDGLPDAVMLGLRSLSDTTPRLTVQLNTGAGFTESREIALPGDIASRLIGAKTEHGDFDGDGRMDFAIFKAGEPVQLLLAGTQGNFGTLWPLSVVPSGDNAEWAQVIDVNNDGLLDFTWRQGILLKVARRTQAIDVLKRVHGNTQVMNSQRFSGLNYSFEYAPLSQSNPHGNVTPSELFYTTELVDDPYRPWLRLASESMRVVSRMSLNSNEQQQRSWRYLYRDGRSDTQGLGWLGFGARVVVDELTGARTTTVYENTSILREPAGYQYESKVVYPRKAVAPLAHLPLEETVEVPLDGGAKQQTQRTWTYSRSPAAYAPTYQQYASRVVETVKEIKGSTVTMVSETETLTELDAYGTPVKSTQLVHGANKTEQVEQVTAVGAHGFDPEMWRPQGTWSVTRSWTACAKSPTVGCPVGPDAANVRTQTLTFDGRGQVESVDLEPSRSGEGHLPPETSETYLKTTFLRDSRGLIHSVEREGGGVKRVESVTYDDVDQTQVVSSTDAEGATWKYLFHLGLGVLAQTEDPNHVHTRFQYDGFGRPRVVTPLYRGPSVAPGDQSVVRTFYERYGALLQQRTQVATGGVTPTETITRFDAMGRPVSSQGPRFDGETVVSSVKYDAQGRVWKLEAPRTSTENPTWESYEYDALNRLTVRRMGDGISSPMGTLVERLTYSVPTAYATQTSVKDALGLEKKSVFDFRGLMVTATEAVGTPKEVTMAYGYGPFGRLETTDDPQGNRSLNVYDAQGRLERSVDPGAGTRTYRYNAFGEVKREADGLEGMTGLLATTYERDRLGRVLSAKNSQEELAYEYDLGMGAMRRLTKATRTVLGGPTEVVTTQHFYDEFGRETDTQQDAAGISLTMSRQFDDYGRLSRLTYPVTLNAQPVSISYAYNARGALSGIYRTGTFFMAYWSALERDSVGRLKKTRYGNGVERESRYDSRGRLRFLEAKRSGVNVQRLAYEYTANDNLAARHDLMVGVTEKFSYDALDRLEWWRVLQNCQRLETQFQYDGLGNLLSRSPVTGWEPSALLNYNGGTSGGPHAVKQAQLGSDSFTYEYDHRGNQLASRDGAGALIRSVDYTSFDLPKSITTASGTVAFGYDASGTRVRKKSAQEDVLYVGGLYQRRTQGLTTTHVLSIPSPEGVIGELSWDEGASTENVRYFLNDRQGSPDTVTDASGSVVERIKYDPFGARRSAGNLAQAPSAFHSGARKGYTGHEHDDELGLINMRGRIYDPRLMKFLSVDPVVADPGSVQAFNAYSYVLNNPTRYTDPSGFIPYGGTLVSRWDGDWGGSTSMQSPAMSLVERYMLAPGATPFLPSVDFRVPSVAALDDAKVAPAGHYTNDVGQSSAPYRSSVTSVLTTVSKAVTLPGSDSFACNLFAGCAGLSGIRGQVDTMLKASQAYDHYAPVSKFAAVSYAVNEFVPFVSAGESVKATWEACNSPGATGCAVGIGKSSVHVAMAGAAIYSAGEGIASGVSALSRSARQGMTKARALLGANTARGVPNPHGSRGGPAHRATIERRIDELKAEGHEHVGGGSLPEEVIPTPGGAKTFRRPDITTHAPDGSTYRENVGRSTSEGSPVARERRALNDIEAATGQRPGYTPYDQ
ncbi:RHS repeat-associated core domain-containing protein [Corallococcus coralloides]|uniref:RHS repeat-associated core domain-containing protein n=1 Tax=Corallococcus coralloides TaxID=184914 RepID=UPI00384AAE2D